MADERPAYAYSVRTPYSVRTSWIQHNKTKCSLFMKVSDITMEEIDIDSEKDTENVTFKDLVRYPVLKIT